MAKPTVTLGPQPVFVRGPQLAPKTQMDVVTVPKSCPLRWPQPLGVPSDGRRAWKVPAGVDSGRWRAVLGEDRVGTWGSGRQRMEEIREPGSAGCGSAVTAGWSWGRNRAPCPLKPKCGGRAGNPHPWEMGCDWGPCTALAGTAQWLECRPAG